MREQKHKIPKRTSKPLRKQNKNTQPVEAAVCERKPQTSSNRCNSKRTAAAVYRNHQIRSRRGGSSCCFPPLYLHAPLPSLPAHTAAVSEADMRPIRVSLCGRSSDRGRASCCCSRCQSLDCPPQP